jgi:hypothetical protein
MMEISTKLYQTDWHLTHTGAIKILKLHVSRIELYHLSHLRFSHR